MEMINKIIKRKQNKIFENMWKEYDLFIKGNGNLIFTDLFFIIQTIGLFIYTSKEFNKHLETEIILRLKLVVLNAKIIDIILCNIDAE